MFAFRSRDDGSFEMLSKIPSKVAKAEIGISEEAFQALQYNNLPAIDQEGNPIAVNARLTCDDGKQGRQDKQSRIAKYELVRQVRAEYASLILDANTKRRKNASLAVPIADKYGLSPLSVKKYIAMTEEEVENLKEKRHTKDRITGFDNYKNIAYKMLKDHIDIGTIVYFIKKQGCTLADLTITRHIESIQRHHFPERPIKEFSSIRRTAVFPDGVIVFSRSDVLRQILAVHEEKKDPEVGKVMDIILDRYPELSIASRIYTGFHSAVIGNDPDAIDKWILDNQTGPLSSFVESVKQDIIPIKNAVIHTESSGFVEGNNTKFKLIKRILFGRSGRVNLEIRFIAACLFTKDTFKLTDICPFLDPLLSST